MNNANLPVAPLLALEGPPKRAALPAPQACAPAPAAYTPGTEPMLAIAASPWGSTSAVGSSVSGQVAAMQGAEPMLAIAASPWGSAAAVGSSVSGQVADLQGSSSKSFVPSYEWKIVPDGASVPPGLEVRLPVDGTGQRLARISPSWRMLVVSEPGNDSCRLDVRRNSTLAEVRTAVAASLCEGDVSRVTEIFADGIVLAKESDRTGWTRTVEELSLFGRRITCSLQEAAVGHVGPSPAELGARLDGIETGVAQIERALGASQISVGQAHGDLAQLEAQLNQLQCKGIDCISLSRGGDVARQQRRELTRRAELLQARIGGIFVGLNVARRPGPQNGTAFA